MSQTDTFALRVNADWNEIYSSWHETQAVYSCDFQPLPPTQLKRLLSLVDDDEKGSSSDKGPIIAGGRQYRLATAGGDSKVRVSFPLSFSRQILGPSEEVGCDVMLI